MSFELEYKNYPKPDGIIRYANIPWDSELFGFPCYELDCANTPPEELNKHLGKWLKTIDLGRKFLVYTKIAPDSVKLAQVIAGHGFYFIELSLNICLPLKRFKAVFPQQVEKFSLRQARKEDLGTISKIASTAFSRDRYHLEPMVPKGKAGERYANWVRQGFRDGETVLVVEDLRMKKLMGFFHFREIGGKEIDLSLAAVDVPYQGSGVGAIMYQAALSECRDRGYGTAITRISSNNLDVVNLFSQLGFYVKDTLATYHYTQEKG